MQKIRTIIIDDEEPARRALKNILDLYCPNVELLSEASNIPDGVKLIHKAEPQLVLLDIEMPGYNGFELLDFIKEVNFEIIFITAYSEYALKAFEVSAIDYLLKPVNIDQLNVAIEKVSHKLHASNMQKRVELFKENHTANEFTRIALPVSDGLLFIEVVDIILLEADGAYTHVWLRNGSKILVSKKLKFFEDVLIARKHFYRPHRSYMVNFNFVTKYNKGESMLVMDNKIAVPVSKEKKAELEDVLKEVRVGQ